jgi:hypothetical protein
MERQYMSSRDFRGSLEALLSKRLSPSSDDFDPALTAKEKLRLFRIPVSAAKLRPLTDHMDRQFASHLRVVSAPISKDIILKLKKNYSEALPKTMLLRTADLNGRSGEAKRAATKLGIMAALQSDDLRHFGERVTGRKLVPDPACQIICYEPGDYSGPHTDHHPEQREYRDGYVDLHIMMSSPSVASQLLVYEKRQGVLNAVEEIGRGMSIAVYQLPFWHYTTPMVSRPGLTNARRWLMLASYMIDQDAPARRRAPRSP